GRNGGDNLAVPTIKSQLWVYPPTSFMPAEMAVNNGNINTPVNATGQSATGVDTPGNPWQYSPLASADRGPGAWPPSDANTNVIGDYVFANAEFDPILSQLATSDLDPTQAGVQDGLTELLNLPNVSSYLER